MSAPAHDGWPQEGSVWEHWSDLLLATQLAGLREGYTTVSKVWDARQSHKLAICCHADKTDGRKEACQKRLVHAEAEAPINSETKWKVVRVRSENLSRSQHTRHVGGIGVSDGFKGPPIKPDAYREPTNRPIRNVEPIPSITDQNLGTYPVSEQGRSAKTHEEVVDDPALLAKLESKRFSLSKTLTSLASTRQEIVNLRTKISLASILDETDEVKKLSVGMGDLETKREKKLRKVEKKKRKIEKIKEKIKAKQMEQKKVQGTKSNSATKKKGGKGKKEKGKV